MVAAITGVSIPVFLLAATLLYLFAFRLPWFPNTGYVQFGTNPAQWAYHLILPWLSIAVLSIGFYSRVLRSQRARRDQPGLRAHGQGQGPDRSGRCSSATCCATR